MTTKQLAARALLFYWRSNLAVIAGVATAVAVLAGALLVGDSVRGSLRDLVLQRLGRMDRLVTSTGFFREGLAAQIAADRDIAATYDGAAPLIVLQGAVSDASSGRRVSHVAIYGVDDRFWQFHHVTGVSGPASRDAFVSRALADDLGAQPGSGVLIRVERPSAIPMDSLHGRKENPGRTLRLAVARVLEAERMGDFSIQPQQGSVRALFVPLSRLQQDLDQSGRINAIAVAGGHDGGDGLEAAVKRYAQLADYGLSLRTLDTQGVIALEADAGLIDRRRAEQADRAAAAAGVRTMPVLTYLANTLQTGSAHVPYSLVAAVDLATLGVDLDRGGDASTPPIVINDWTARELGAGIGAPLSLDYYVWQEPGLLETRTARFRVAAVVPIAGPAADRDLSPAYPGITDADTLGDWDPPFPIDLKRVRPADEDYWRRYRTTPKAFVSYEDGARLWASERHGDRTSLRIRPASGRSLKDTSQQFQSSLLSEMAPGAAGFSFLPVKPRALAAAQGTTDFGEYFVYFSFFLVVSALVLAALFFRLGVEQRAREVGLLRAVGYSPARVRRIFTTEGLLLASAGSVFGVAGAVGYAAVMITGLRTWWGGAVGTRALTLHVSAISLVAGAAGALAAAVICIWWALRGLGHLSERELLAGRVGGGTALIRARSTRTVAAAAAFAVVAAGLAGAAFAGGIAQAEAFFGAGTALLGAGICALVAALRRPPRSVVGRGWPAVLRLGRRNASARPGRSVLAVAVIASAAFIVIAVDAFRRGNVDAADRRSGTGGFPLLVDLDVPLVYDPNSPDGRDALGLGDAADVSIAPFRVLPGEDASCLNLYQPVSPRILGAGHGFLAAGRFSFQSAVAGRSEGRANPWLLLEAAQSDGTIPVIADANSMTYVLHKSLGDVFLLHRDDRTLRLKLVGALADSVLQSELVMSEANFTKLFPEQQGYRFLLVDAPPGRAEKVSAAIESGAADFGADAVSTTVRLDEFHAVENTYLSTFQTLGGLGLLLGTIGLAAVLLRSVLERRRELALLRAVGYRPAHLFAIVFAENALLLVCGIGLGAVAAAVAIGPAAMARGARLPISSGGLLLLAAVLVAGVLSSLFATRVALKAPLVTALRTE